jgi:hypothetical protein
MICSSLEKYNPIKVLPKYSYSTTKVISIKEKSLIWLETDVEDLFPLKGTATKVNGKPTNLKAKELLKAHIQRENLQECGQMDI